MSIKCECTCKFNNKIVSDFQKLGGYQVFIPGLNSEHKSVRCKTAELIATLAQNNSYCQEKFFDHPAYICLLMSLVENDPEMDVRIKALLAISSELFFCYINPSLITLNLLHHC